MTNTIITTDPDEVICNKLDALEGELKDDIARIAIGLKDGTLTTQEAISRTEALREVYEQKIKDVCGDAA